jgi:hypothetical protein
VVPAAPDAALFVLPPSMPAPVLSAGLVTGAVLFMAAESVAVVVVLVWSFPQAARLTQSASMGSTIVIDFIVYCFMSF